MERYIAIDYVCAWPNLTRLPDGELIATIFNQPCHGKWEGDVECWASADGRFWEHRGTPAPHDPGANRMNVAAGLAGNGDLIVLASGWTDRPPMPQPRPVFPHDTYEQPTGTGFGESRALTPWVCRSRDGGRTWTHDGEIEPPADSDYFVPFGDVTPAPGGALCATCYSSGKVWLVKSLDDGQTWTERFLIAEKRNETDILCIDGSEWIAVARSAVGLGMAIFRSKDDGASWSAEGSVTLSNQHPGHLLRLQDGRILLSFGIRNVDLHGVGVRLSSDDGRTWSNPRLLVQVDRHADCGYPSSAQLADGTVVTAWYASNTPEHQRYHMGAARWRPED